MRHGGTGCGKVVDRKVDGCFGCGVCNYQFVSPNKTKRGWLWRGCADNSMVISVAVHARKIFIFQYGMAGLVVERWTENLIVILVLLYVIIFFITQSDGEDDCEKPKDRRPEYL